MNFSDNGEFSFYGKAKNSTPDRIKTPDRIEIKFDAVDYVVEGTLVQNFMQISLSGLLGKWVKYAQNFLFIYAFFLQRTHRSDLLRDFYA